MNSHLDHAYKLGQQLAEFEKQADLLDAMARVSKHMNKSPIQRAAVTAELARRLGAVSGTAYGAKKGLELASTLEHTGGPLADLILGLGGATVGNLSGRLAGTASGALAGKLTALPGIRQAEKALTVPLLR